MARSGWNWLEMVGNDWKKLDMARNGLKGLETTVNDCQFLKMAGNVRFFLNCLVFLN